MRVLWFQDWTWLLVPASAFSGLEASAKVSSDPAWDGFLAVPGLSQIHRGEGGEDPGFHFGTSLKQARSQRDVP